MKSGYEMPKVYQPSAVEDRQYQFWLEGGFFHAEVEEDKEPFCIVIPPPNVTGQLHLGHAWDNTLQDIIIRWRRMQGYNAVWIPGTDHAGIATQIRVEEELAREGLSRHDLGREKFLERVWAWKNEYGSRIINQLKRLGSSCDWKRERFTMDEAYSRAVREVFVRLYEKGLIYQGYRIINWCPRCYTALSDIEVEHQEEEGRLYHIRYPLVDGGYVEVATTRPETMLGDTAVAVHPADDRYSSLVGKTAILPLMERRIPIVADEYVDPSFGTGAVKVTPAHDPNDYEIAQRHGLPHVVVIGEDGRMTSEAGRFAGLERYQCRKAVVAELERQGFLVKVENHAHSVGHCSRCETVVEPLLSKQWFVRMEPLARPALEVVREGRVRFIPERFTRLYLNWMENVRDWCISRQLWWGHRIPVWYCRECGQVIAARQDPTTCSRCGSDHLEQDPDVLDTWFSSALWPFATLGWPEQTPELRHFYPTSVLVTGFDIIFFWVARMIFMGLEFMGEVPFREVCIHGLVRDALGRKMSKSLGNGVDPLEVIEEFGADALRFSLVTGVAPGYDMRFYREKVESSRNFANKVWNASRFVLLHLRDFQVEGEPTPKELRALPLTLADRWILSRYVAAVAEVTRQLERYDLGEAARVIYDFLWSEVCDWYIEAVKPRLYGKEAPETRVAAQTVLWYVLEHTLRLLHPFMPFLTEEIWQYLPHQGRTIMKAPWPQAPAELVDREAEEEFSALQEVIRAVRTLRTEANVPPAREVAVILRGDSPGRNLVERNEPLVRNLAGVESLSYLPREAARPEKALVAVAVGIELYLPLAGLVDVGKELTRLEKELAEMEEEIARLKAKLSNHGFLQKAPAEVVERERARYQELTEKYSKMRARREELARL